MEKSKKLLCRLRNIAKPKVGFGAVNFYGSIGHLKRLVLSIKSAANKSVILASRFGQFTGKTDNSFN